VSGKRQQTQRQLELSFEVGRAATAADPAPRRAEPPAAKREAEGPASIEPLMEEVCERENLKKALKQVKSNGGGPGVDRMTVEKLPGHLAKHWPAIRERLFAGTYEPQPVKRVEIPKPGGGVRKLGIPTVLDRFIQQAVLQVLQKRWDRTFSEHSYGFRPGRSAHQAVLAAQQHIAAGHRFVVDLDLEKFFDRVNHDILMSRVARRIADKRLLGLIRGFLTAGVLENGLVGPTDEGTPQGGPLSPLLSNIMLDDLDRELARRGLRFARYADDCNIYVRSRRAGERVKKGITDFLTKTLKLKVNEEKSAVARPWERKFLGFTFSMDPAPKRRIAPKALDRFKDRIREITRRTRGIGIERMVQETATFLRGWNGYFGHCETPTLLRDLNSWVRRRLRCFLWRQWKRGRRRFEELRKRGVPPRNAAAVAGSPHGPWRIAASPPVNQALPDAYFASLGLPTLAVRSAA